MKRFEMITKAITLICFGMAVLYGLIIWDIGIVAKCLFGGAVCFLPDLIYSLSKRRISGVLCGLFYLFLLGSVFLTELFSFYTLIPWWDSFLHGFSGVVLTMFGFEVASFFYFDKSKINSFFIGLFAFSFALSVGALWEIYEYSFDCILGMNMQRFSSFDGQLLSGQAALYDTMKDLIVDCIAALVTALACGIWLKMRGDDCEVISKS